MHYDYIVYGYHGCDERTWENDPLRAKKWWKKDFSHPVILEAAIF